MATIIVAIVLLGIGILGMAVRLLFIKNSEARGGCASKNPMLMEEGVVCGVCGRTVGEECGESKLEIKN
jgi:hypothetical protein